MKSDTQSAADRKLDLAPPTGDHRSDAPDPDFPIEGGGGPMDDGGVVHTGPPPPAPE